MEDRKGVIYIFLHIQKCGGTTFHTHIDKNLKPEQVISLYDGYRNFDVQRGKWEYIDNRTDAERYLRSLSESQKEKVKVIYGRDLWYGIHKHFTQTPRYVVFFREPVTRIVSNYNYYRKIAETADQEIKKISNTVRRLEIEHIRQEMQEDGKTVSFDYWLKHRARPNYMLSHLIKWGFIESTSAKISTEDIQQALDKFYFVGLTESFDTDAAFLYYKLGLHGPYTNQNVSEKFFVLKDNKKVEEMILSRNTPDQELYEYARRRNEAFKRTYGPMFFRAPFALRNVYRVLFKSTNALSSIVDLVVHPLKYLYRISALLKRHSSGYASFIKFIKTYDICKSPTWYL